MSTFGIGNTSAKQIGYFSRDQKILCEKHAIPFLPLQPAFDLDGPVTCPYCEWETKMDYQKHAAGFLLDAGLEFRAVLVGNDCPQFCEDSQKEIDMDKLDVYPRKTHIHGKHYRCTISAKNRGHVSFDFWNSYRDEEENFFAFGQHESLTNWVTGRDNCYWDKYRIDHKYPNRPRTKKRIIPTAYDLLTCITKYDPETFENFCSEYGYDEDSRKAEDIYRAVVKEWHKVEKFFTSEELAAIQEIQ